MKRHLNRTPEVVENPIFRGFPELLERLNAARNDDNAIENGSEY